MHRSTRSEQIDQKRALQTAKKARHHKSNGKTTLLFQIGYIGRVLPNIAGWRKLKTVLIQHAFWQALLSLYAFWNCLSSWGFSKESTTLKWYGKWGSFSGWWLFGELQEQSMMSDLERWWHKYGGEWSYLPGQLHSAHIVTPWEDKCNIRHAITQIQTELESVGILWPSIPSEISTDASKDGLQTVFLQQQWPMSSGRWPRWNITTNVDIGSSLWMGEIPWIHLQTATNVYICSNVPPRSSSGWHRPLLL